MVLGMAVKLSFLGEPDKVGRSAYLVSGSRNILIDYGVDIDKIPKFPKTVSVFELDLFIISHAHLDHMGASPQLYVSGNMPCLLTHSTLDISDILIRDFMKLSGEYLTFEYIDFLNLERNSNFMSYRIRYGYRDVGIKFYDAGHIPGSAQVVVELDGKTILYTGDINTYETRLLTPADLDYDEEFDAVVIESTYGDTRHPDRFESERMFVQLARETIENGGTVLVPAFAVARSQEILLILYEHRFEYPVVMDGMAIEVTKMLLSHGRYLKDVKKLRNAFDKARKIYRWRERKEVVKEPCLIIAPAGMLGGGSSVYYLNKLIKNPKNRIFLVGYQAPGSPGRSLLESKRDERKMADIRYIRFSAHADSIGILKILKSLNGDPKIFVVHGNKESRLNVDMMARECCGYKVYLPRHGEVYKI
ncbi:MAG TPA: MBL fold metallo-hydrolase [Thermoprotei archaeon]|nr:MBL fold metallo-hydrolase [Thermoprotei archaeon]